MRVTVSIGAVKEGEDIAKIAAYAIAAIAIIYALYKLFGLFKDLGRNIEGKLNELKNKLGNLDLNPSDAPGKFKETGEDIWTIIKGTLTGKQNTGEYHKAMTDLHYGGPQWGPGTGFDTSKIKQGILRKYGQDIKPGETKTFAGGTYTETVVSNMVKCKYAGGEVLSKEDCLARKYGFTTYAQFNAWLSGVKAALKAAGKDPSSMSLDQIVKYGRELSKKKGSGTAYFAAQGENPFTEKKSVPAYKPLPASLANKLNKIVHPVVPIGGSLAARGLIPLDNGMCVDVKQGNKIVPCPPVPNRPVMHILPVIPDLRKE
ncbi:hypothetical protein [Thermococcus sp.]